MQRLFGNLWQMVFAEENRIKRNRGEVLQASLLLNPVGYATAGLVCKPSETNISDSAVVSSLKETTGI